MPDLRLYAAAIGLAGAIAAAGAILYGLCCAVRASSAASQTRARWFARFSTCVANAWFAPGCLGLAWLALAIIAGWWVLEITPRWPPRNGLDRLLILVLPAAWLGIVAIRVVAKNRFLDRNPDRNPESNPENDADSEPDSEPENDPESNPASNRESDDGNSPENSVESIPANRPDSSHPNKHPRVADRAPPRLHTLAPWRGRLAWGLLAASILPTLLWGSVHLRVESSDGPWPLVPWLVRAGVWTLLTLVFVVHREWLERLEQRTADGSVRTALALAVGTAAQLILCGGYLKGGAAALPVAAALLGGALPIAAVATGAIRLRGWAAAASGGDTLVVSLAAVALAGWLVVGTCFGNVGLLPAAVTWLAPLLAAAVDWLWPARPSRTGRRRLGRWLARIGLVALPLALVATVAFRQFEQKYRPFTSRDPVPGTTRSIAADFPAPARSAR